MTAHVVVGECTCAASAYVGMTRGREANTAHLVAADVAEAREQWIAVFARDRADLGVAHATQQAAAEVARHAPGRPLEQVLAELREAWTVEKRCLDRLAFLQRQGDTLREVVTLEAPHAGELPRLEAASEQAAVAAEGAEQRAEASDAALSAHAEKVRGALLTGWDGDRDAARDAARVVLDGPGRLRLRNAAVTRAGEQLSDWADRWRPHLPDLPIHTADLAQIADRFDDRPALWRAFDASARRAAARAHPGHTELRAAARAARDAHERARHELAQARRQRDDRLRPFGPVAWEADPAGRLVDLARDLATFGQALTDTRTRIAALTAQPALLPDRLTRERDAWRAQQTAEQLARQRATQASRLARSEGGVRPTRPEDLRYLAGRPSRGPGIGR